MGFPQPAPVCGPMCTATPGWMLSVMNHAEKRHLRTSHQRPENELVALLWVIVALLAALNAVWWLGQQIYS